MAASPASGPEAKFVSATITNFRASYPGPGRSQLVVAHVFGESESDLFERGKLEIVGLATYGITRSSSSLGADSRTTTFMEIEGVPSVTVVGRTAKLYDKRWTWRNCFSKR